MYVSKPARALIVPVILQFVACVLAHLAQVAARLDPLEFLYAIGSLVSVVAAGFVYAHNVIDLMRTPESIIIRHVVGAWAATIVFAWISALVGLVAVSRLMTLEALILTACVATVGYPLYKKWIESE